MSIAEKLTTIAENQQRVFDAGRNSGGGGGDYDSGYNEGYSNGYDSGYSEGYDLGSSEGYDSGYFSGYDEGQAAEYDRFWDAFQRNGELTNYTHAFAGLGWTAENLRPKYPVRPTGWIERMFFKNQAAEPLANGEFDFSQAIDCRYMFAEAAAERIGFIDLSGCNELTYPFYYLPFLHTIDTLKLRNDGSQTFTGDWMYTDNLENLTIEGTFGNDVSFWCCGKLSKASITSIINHLSTTASGKTLTLKQAAVTNAFGSTTASAWTTLVNSKKNWTISLV